MWAKLCIVCSILYSLNIWLSFWQEFIKNLGSRTVAYLNVDISVQGNYTFRLKSIPSIKEAVFSATKKVCLSAYTVHLKKSLHFEKVSPDKYFQEFFIPMDSEVSLLSNKTKGSDNILCLSEQKPFCERVQTPVLTRMIIFGWHQKSWKGWEIFIFWWF